MNALEMAQGHPTLEKAVKRSRAMLHRKAMTGAVTDACSIGVVITWLPRLR